MNKQTIKIVGIGLIGILGAMGLYKLTTMNDDANRRDYAEKNRANILSDNSSSTSSNSSDYGDDNSIHEEEFDPEFNSTDKELDQQFKGGKTKSKRKNQKNKKSKSKSKKAKGKAKK
jgi:hypothetical protein